MKPTHQLRHLGQSLWLDNITRDLLDSGVLQRYIENFAVTGLTSNPTIFDEALANTHAYDASLQSSARAGLSPEDAFIDVALEDLRRAADLFRPTFDASEGIDGWVSMEVSPMLANDTARTIKAAARIFKKIERPNCFIKIPGTPAGLTAIEDSIFAGIPVNVTLLFSREQYLAAAKAYMRGIERRIAAGLSPLVASVASLFISRWDKAVSQTAPTELRNRLGIAMGNRTYRAYRDFLNTPRWRKLVAQGARPQRLLWASTGTKDPNESPTLYIEALAMPYTINTMPEKTLQAVAQCGAIEPVPEDQSSDIEARLTRFALAGIDIDALALQLQGEGAASFIKSWEQLMQRVADKRRAAA
jgi:transaldolase